jgi:pimeloyl-ACP methyl ester carboxylesterase
VNIIQGMHLSRMRIVLIAVVLAIAGLLVSASQIGPCRGRYRPRLRRRRAKPAVVLEHGVWADGSSWTGEIQRLQADGYTVYAPPNPLRGLADDSAALADFLKTITGPIILVGHSYGGMVVTNAATGNPNVKALVYIDAFIPARGETAFGLTGAKPGSCLGSANAFTAVPYPGAPAGDFDAYLKAGPDAPYPGFAQCFADCLPPARPPCWPPPSAP